MVFISQCGYNNSMDGGTNRDMDVSIIDKDESSDKAYHVVDGFVIEDSKKPFPVSCNCNYHYFLT